MKKYSKIIRGVLYVTILFGMLFFSTKTYGTESISISHSLTGYTDDGPTITLDFTLDITNNGATALRDAEVSVGPMSDTFLEPLPGQSPLLIADIPANGSTLVTYSIKSTFILPQEDVTEIPIFWEVRYIDDAGNENMVVVEGSPTSNQ